MNLLFLFLRSKLLFLAVTLYLILSLSLVIAFRFLLSALQVPLRLFKSRAVVSKQIDHFANWFPSFAPSTVKCTQSTSLSVARKTILRTWRFYNWRKSSRDVLFSQSIETDEMHLQYELIEFNGIWLTHAQQYRWLQVDYQIGVFISRSSVNLISINKIWILSVLQVMTRDKEVS